MKQENNTVEYQIPSNFLTPSSTTPVYDDSKTHDERLYQELSDVSSEVIRCRNAILAKIS